MLITTQGFLRWAEDAAIELPLPLACTPALRDWLTQACAGKRLVFLGEPDHFIRERTDYRLALLDALLPLGFTELAEELCFADGHEVNAWLHHANPEGLERLATFGYTGDVRADRDDRATGVLKASFDRGPPPGLVREQRRFFAALRSFFERLPHASFHGIDVDYTPGAGYRHALAELRDAATANGVQEWLALLQRQPGESLAAERQRLTACLNRAQLLPAVAPAVRHVRAMLAGLSYIDLAHPAPDYQALGPAMALRERAMQAQADELIAAAGTAGIVFMGHNLHLARNDALVLNAGGVTPGGNGEHSLGHHINAAHGEEMLVVWMIQGYGHDSQPLPDLPTRLEAPPGSLNALLCQLGEAYLLPTRSMEPGARLLQMPQTIHHMYNSCFETTLAQQVDAVLFVREVSPA